MSGGVDSSVTAALLASRDYDLSAVFMRNWDTRDESGTEQGCEWEKDWEDVQRVCRMLDVPCEMIDLSKDYWNRVFEPSLRAWEEGVTPNPDVWCNREVKFGALMDRLAPDAKWFATGHYAQKSWSSDPNPRPLLVRSQDIDKCQTYYLSAIREANLARTLFPIGHLTKPEVRALAVAHKLPTAERAESMGICFIGERRRFSDFISKYITPRPGRIIESTTGKVVGEHAGLWTYTIGQGARIPGMPERMFVSDKDVARNEVHVVMGLDHPTLYKTSITIADWEWIWADAPPPAVDAPHGFAAQMLFRHRMTPIPCTVYRPDPRMPARITIAFADPQKAVALGQIATVYDGAVCLGSGVITAADRGAQAQV